MVSLWKSLEGNQRLSPRTSPPLTPQLSSAAVPGFTSVTLESQYPHLAPDKVPWAQVRHRSREMGGLTCRVWGPLAQTQPWKWEICHQKLGLILSPSGSLVPPAAQALSFLWIGGGWASHALLQSPSCPPHLAKAEKRREDGRHVCSSEHSAALPPLCTDEETTGPLRTSKMWPLGSCCLPLGFPWLGIHTKRANPPWIGKDISRQGSGGISAQTWGFTSFSFCLLWPPALDGGTQVLVLSQPRAVWLQLGLRTLFSQSPPEMEFTSHLQSVHKLFQSTYCIPGIGAK